MRRIDSKHVMFVILTVAGTSSISMLGGVGLELVEDKLLPLIPLLIALPAINTTAADYAAITASHAVDPAERINSRRELAKSMAGSMVISILGILVLSILVAWQRGYVLTPELIGEFTGFTVFSLASVVTAAAAWFLF